MPGRVLRVVTRLNQGGPWRQLLALVPGLASRGWDGPVLVGRTEPHEPDGTADLEARGADVVVVPGLKRGIDPVADARACDAILREIRRFRPHVVHTHMGKAGALGRLAARTSRVPAVHTLHGHHFGRGGLEGAAARGAERALGRCTAALVCLSDRQRQDVLRHRIVPAERTRLIAPGLDTGMFDIGRDRRAHAGFHVMWTGRFVAVKAPHRVVDLVASLPETFCATMLGDGPLYSRVVRSIASRGLTERIACPGAVDDVPGRLATADAFVLPSDSEGLSIAAIEAMLAGLPVVVTAVGGMPDLVEDGVNGLLVQPGDDEALVRAVRRLADDPAWAHELGSAARSVARARYGADRLADDTAALYDTVARRSGADGTIRPAWPTPSTP